MNLLHLYVSIYNHLIIDLVESSNITDPEEVDYAVYVYCEETDECLNDAVRMIL